jgi:hypothetical protein
VGFRDDLDLTDILSSYREHLGAYGGSVGVNFVDEKKRQPEQEFDAIPKSLYARRQVVSEEPERIGDGPMTCSTCTDVISARATFAWDVNGWYRTVGVRWPYADATSGMLSRAYIATGGQSSARATYYLKRLLDKPSRAAYDAMPLGEVFLDDQYVQDEMKAKAQAEASRRSQGGTFTNAVSVLDEWGYLLRDDAKDDLDAESGLVQDEVAPEADVFEPTEWTYAYWLWRSRGCGPTRFGTTARLEQWQSLLVSALSVRKARVNLAVGLMGRQPQDYVVGRFDGHYVVFLNDAMEPTQKMAVQAANLLIHKMLNTI